MRTIGHVMTQQRWAVASWFVLSLCAVVTGCAAELDPKSERGTNDALTAPSGWTCTSSYYGTNDGCDCGCGTSDPDCPSSSSGACEYNWCGSGLPNSSQNWRCGSSSGGGGGYGSSCTSSSPCASGLVCRYASNYASGETCQYAGVAGDYCRVAGNCASGFTCSGSACRASTPSGGTWTCSPGYRGTNDGCDCGCGSLDPDCSSGSASACQYRWCPSGQQPNASQNWLCGGGTGSTSCTSDSQCSGGNICRPSSVGSSTQQCQSPGTTSSACSSSSDCASGYSCTYSSALGGSVCQTTGGGTSTCTSTSQCTGGNVCRPILPGSATYQCLPPGSAGAGCYPWSYDHCTTPYSCSSTGRCGITAGYTCTTDDQCQVGLVCRGNYGSSTTQFCASPGTTGQGCGTTSDCASGYSCTYSSAHGGSICQSSAASCTSTSQCTGGNVCRPTSPGSATYQCQPPGSAGAGCYPWSYDHCTTPYSCSSTGRCGLTAGYTCTTDDQCQVGLVCRGNYGSSTTQFCASPGTTGQGCGTTSDCASGYSCSYSTAHGGNVCI